jgi:hypothetical protein
VPAESTYRQPDNFIRSRSGREISAYNQREPSMPDSYFRNAMGNAIVYMFMRGFSGGMWNA